MKTNFWSYSFPQFEAFPDGEDLHTPWAGHKRFGYDLIRAIKPSIIVELGTHRGTSFFSFLQAMKDEKLFDIKAFAIDTWMGDLHTNKYSEGVYQFIEKTIKDHFPNLNVELIRDTFDNSLNRFENNSIDLLHIDGLHTYDAVKHDFDSWLPKLRQNGIILMHDIHEYRDDFGVYKLWSEIKRGYLTLEFEHSHGLGIVFLDNSTFNEFNSNFEKIKSHYHNINYQELKGKLYDS